MSENDQEIANAFRSSDGRPLSAEGMRAAHNAFRSGVPIASGESKGHAGAYTRVDGAARALNDKMLQIAHGSGTQEEKLAQMQEWDKPFTDDVNNLLSYKMDPKDEPVKNRQHLISMAQAVSGGKYNPVYYKKAMDMLDTNKSTGKIVYRVNTAAAGATQIMDALRAFKENERIPVKKMASLLEYGLGWSGEEKYSTLYSALNTFALEASAIPGQGQIKVTLVNNLKSHLHEYSTPAQLRAQVAVELGSGYANIDTVRDEWEQFTGNRDYPLLSKKTMDTYRSYMFMRRDTGELPADAPYEIRYTSKSGKDRTDLPPEKRSPPLTLADRDRYDAFVNKYENQTSDPAILETIAKLKVLLAQR
jgi:hypothetical protein